ncbi:MAG: hypothetical protein KA886_07245 [Candidatus Cloacimonetes bacterium]|nr:hypothetical protein [Candidatus Cloacimonadota bacterium]
MKRRFLKEEIEYRYERNRSGRLSGWKGLIIKILLFALLIHFFISFNKDSAQNILWFISGGNEEYAGIEERN